MAVLTLWLFPFSLYNNNSDNMLAFGLEVFKSGQKHYKNCFVLCPFQQYTNKTAEQLDGGEGVSNRKVKVVTLPLFHSQQAAGVFTSDHRFEFSGSSTLSDLQKNMAATFACIPCVFSRLCRFHFTDFAKRKFKGSWGSPQYLTYYTSTL